ncbi:hypothetical protein [Lysinibacillus sp. FSL W8-0992]|uniref:hypothetical protein n=1 Tax=Lysinibacillus sp. FSL W8-0992 TaxID=2954643 RepID=UPI0030FB02AF
MMFKNKMQVVPVNEFTDYTERFEALDKMREETKFATRKDVALMTAIPTVGAISLFAYNKMTSVSSTINEVAAVQSIQQSIPVTVEPVQSLVDAYTSTAIPVNALAQPTGIITEKSFEILATALEPLVQVLMAISFPVASVIMVGACFFFMFGNKERGWDAIMNAGLGYVLIQMSPLFLEILRTIGKAV